MYKLGIYWLFICSLFSCQPAPNPTPIPTQNIDAKVYLKVLGIVQDAGYPQMGCMKACCKERWHPSAQQKHVTSLGLIDKEHQKKWIFEASPDFRQQTKMLSDELDSSSFSTPDGIFLTHAHIGHYAGLIYLGRESMNAKGVPVYAMPRMKKYLQSNGPWSLLDSLQNITFQPTANNSKAVLSPTVSVIPLEVPHRGEFSETVGYKIIGPNKSALFIPDIDKWHLWKRDIKTMIKEVDYALLDATFFANGEVGNRDMSEIPHPFVEESMRLFEDLPAEEKSKVYFIHFNHTNPLLQDGSEAQKQVIEKGYRIATEGLALGL